MQSSTALFSTPTRNIPELPVSDRTTDEQILGSKRDMANLRAEGIQPYPEQVGFRYHIAPGTSEAHEFADGYYDFVRVAQGLCARVVSANVLKTVGSRSLGDNWLKIDLYVSGRQSLVFDGAGQVDFDEQWCNVHLHPPGMAKGEWMSDGTQARGIMLYVHRSFLGEYFGSTDFPLPQALASFAAGCDDQFLFEQVPVSSVMARAINDIIETPYSGGLRRLFLQARCLDILAAVLSAMGNDRTENAPSLRGRDRARIHQARAILEGCLHDTPSVRDLARRVGINQQKLKVGFKQIVGTTMSDFRQERRLTAAWRLLKETDRTIGQIAFDVGYEFPTNFATAFKRRYGIAPSRFRKSGGTAPT
jgi:AraC-like DNA-binding protein